MRIYVNAEHYLEYNTPIPFLKNLLQKLLYNAHTLDKVLNVKVITKFCATKLSYMKQKLYHGIGSRLYILFYIVLEFPGLSQCHMNCC